MQRAIDNPMPAGARQRGMTLVELMLALAGTALVAAAIFALTSALAAGSESRTDLRELTVKHKAVAARLTAAVRQSSMVLDKGDDWVLLWVYDERDDDEPNPSELQLIERGGDDVLSSYVLAWPPLWTEEMIAAADIPLPLDTDWPAAIAGLKALSDPNQPRLDRTDWATRITSFDIALEKPDVQSARFLDFRIGVQANALQDMAIGAATLRN